MGGFEPKQNLKICIHVLHLFLDNKSQICRSFMDIWHNMELHVWFAECIYEGAPPQGGGGMSSSDS